MSTASKTQQIDSEILKQAIDWYMLQQEQPLSAAQQQQFEQWQKQNPLHLAAWQRTLKLQQRLGHIPAELSKKTLAHSPHPRYRIDKLLVLFALGGAVAAAVYSNQQQAWLADYRTAYGEQKTIQLEDGSRLMLNSKTAIDVRYSDQQRQIVLHYGEVFVQTGKELSPNYRPFRVLGRDGVIQALGTQFDVVQDQQQTHVAVLEHAVRISTSHGKQQQYLAAGQQLSFDGYSIMPSGAFNASNLAWRQGLLVANQIPLQQFAKLIEKNYGVKLEISPALQSMLISGTYPSTNLERLLFSLEQTYAIQTQQHFFGNKVKISK